MRDSARAIVIQDGKLLVNKRNKYGLEFIALPGGGVEEGESFEQAAIREIKEECSIDIGDLRLVIIEDANQYGLQHIFTAEYIGGEPKVAENTPEARDNEIGRNTYQPVWLPVKELATHNFLPVELKDLVIKFINEGFPDQPVNLKIKDDSEL